MRPDEYKSLQEHNSRGSRLELFFYERVGTRYYLRFTNLSLALVVFLTVIPCVVILALYFKQSRADLDNVNINVRVEPQPPANYGTIVMPPPPAMPTPPKAGRNLRGGAPAREATAAPGVNANTTLTPSPTPSPTPPKPPS